MLEKGRAKTNIRAAMRKMGALQDGAVVHGRFNFKGILHHCAKTKAVTRAIKGGNQFGRFCPGCNRIHPLDELIPQIVWRDSFPNVVTYVGMNLMLDTAFEGSAYSATGPFMGLISSVSWSAVAIGDTMGSHAGWTEAGPTNAPNYSENRATPSWNSAASGVKDLSTDSTYTMSESGTVKGGFLVYGTGAVNTKDSTAGVLWSAGTFSADKVVDNTTTLSVDYQTDLVP